MPSLILQAAVRYLIPLQIIFSLILLIRGHNEPGGGFVGGLVAASAFALFAIAYDVDTTRRILRFEPRELIVGGLTLAVTGGIIGLLAGEAFMTGVWLDADVPLLGHVGTPTIFDLGVYFVVIGVALEFVLTLAEEDLA